MKGEMTRLIFRSKGTHVGRRHGAFDSKDPSHLSAGPALVGLWRAIDDASDVCFVFEVEDTGRTKEYAATPESAKARDVPGVIEGDYDIVRSET